MPNSIIEAQITFEEEQRKLPLKERKKLKVQRLPDYKLAILVNSIQKYKSENKNNTGVW